MAEDKVEKVEGFVLGQIITSKENVIVKDGVVVDTLELLIDLANKIERAGLK